MIAFNNPILREVEGSIRLTRGRPIVVKADRSGVWFREKRRRTWFGPLSWGSLFAQAVQAEADRKIAERRLLRAAKKRSSRRSR